MLFLAPPLCENSYTSWGFLLLLYYSIKLARYKVGICISKEDARSHLLERFYICQPHKSLLLNDIYLPSLYYRTLHITLDLLAPDPFRIMLSKGGSLDIFSSILMVFEVCSRASNIAFLLDWAQMFIPKSRVPSFFEKWQVVIKFLCLLNKYNFKLIL